VGSKANRQRTLSVAFWASANSFNLPLRCEARDHFGTLRLIDQLQDFDHSSLFPSKNSPFFIHLVSNHFASSASVSGRSTSGILLTSTWNLYPLFPLKSGQLRDSHIVGASKNLCLCWYAIVISYTATTCFAFRRCWTVVTKPFVRG